MSIYGYRRGSIFWALTLIAVGGIFLYQNFNPAIHPWQIIGKFWPLLIIFWGLSKLMAHIQARTHPDMVPPPLFSGSEVILLVLILILGTLMSKIVLRPWQQWPSALGINVDEEDFANLFLDSFSYTQTLSQPVKEPKTRLLVVNRRGDVEVRALEQSTPATLDAVVKKTIQAANEDAAKKLSDQLKIEIVEQAGGYSLKSNLDSLPNGGRNVRLDITLRVPKGTTTEITAERGDIVLDGLRGDQTLTANRGDVRVSGVDGLVRVHKSGGSTEIRQVKGNVEVEGRGSDVAVSNVTGAVTVKGEFPGAVQFQDVSQTLRYTSSRTDLTAQKLTGRLNMEVGSLEASGIDGPFEISTRQKDISLEGFKHSVKIADTNGDIELRSNGAPTHPIEVDSQKGGIELTLPPESNFQIDATSRHGEVDCDFSGPGLKVNKEGDEASIKGGYGKGGPTIRLSTAYGTIGLVRQRSQHPAPPSPPPTPGGEKRVSARPRPPALSSPPPRPPLPTVSRMPDLSQECKICPTSLQVFPAGL